MKLILITLVALVVGMMVACGNTAAPTVTPTNTSKQTATYPTYTPVPAPTFALHSESTPMPTYTPYPKPTYTPKPRPTSTPNTACTEKVPGHVFVGAVSLDGVAEADGADVTAWVDGALVADTQVSGGEYVLLVFQGNSCFAGKTVSFKVSGVDVAETAAWIQGGAEVLDLVATHRTPAVEILEIIPIRASSGQLITVIGSGYPPNTTASTLTIGSANAMPSGGISTDAFGSFTQIIEVPAATTGGSLSSGTQIVTVTIGNTTGTSTSFYVPNPSIKISPSSAWVEDVIVIIGEGFSSLGSVTTLTIGTASVLPSPAPRATMSGAITAEFIVPLLNPGTYTVTMANATTGFSASTTFIALSAGAQTATPRPTATSNASSYFNKGMEYYRAENWVMAVGEFTRAIELGSSNVLVTIKAYYKRGFSYRKLGEYQTAINDYTKVIQLDPSDAWVYSYRGVLYAVLGRYGDAINDYTKAIQLDPDFALAYYSRGISYANLGEYQTAIDDFTKAIQLDPSDALPYANRGIAYRNLGQSTLADADKATACSLDSQYC
jgi:Flp pilus assembly protein TadD